MLPGEYFVKLVLGIKSYDLKTGQLYLLSQNGYKLELPTDYLYYTTNPSYAIEQLLTQYAVISPDWVTPKLIACKDDVVLSLHLIPSEGDFAPAKKADLFLIYSVVIPYDTSIINSYWLPLEKCMDNPFISYITQEDE